MTSTYSTRLRFEQQAAGDNLNTWGPKINAAVLRLEEAIAGRTAISTYPITLSTANGTTDQAREMFLDCSGAGGTITIPAVEKLYFVRNNSAATITVTTGSGATATVLVGEVKAVLCDGTNVYAEFLTGAYLPLAGGTLTGGLTGTTASFSGAVTGASYTGGAISGTTGTFSGAVSATSYGAVSATTGSFSSTLNVSGVTTLTNTASITGAAGTFRGVNFQTAGVARWGMGANSTSESGSNAGSDFYINRLTDAGAAIDTVLGINRATGLVNIGNSLQVNTNATIGGTLGITGAATFSSSLTAASLAGTALASTAQTLTGSSTTQAVTPAGMAGNASIANPGYYKLPGGLIIAWGSISTSAVGSVTLTLPTTFTSSSSYTVTLSQNNSAGGGSFASVASGTKTTTTAGIDGWGSGGGRVAVAFDYQIIGY